MNDRLRQLQLRFKAYLQQDDPAIHDDIVDSDDARAEHRLAAYWNAYRLRLIESLGEDYDHLKALLGDEDFETLILDYIAAHPSRQRSIRWVGQHLPEFLRQRRQPFLAELASFEWSLGLCFDAAESERSASPEDMAAIPPEQWPSLRFGFEPSLRWIDLEWNAVAVWQALEAGETPPQPQQGDYPVRWLLWRQDEELHWRSLEGAEAWAIEAALAGADFAAISEGLLEWHGADTVAMAAAGHLRQWLHDGLISRIEY
jgi:hypothetical protein